MGIGDILGLPVSADGMRERIEDLANNDEMGEQGVRITEDEYLRLKNAMARVFYPIGGHVVGMSHARHLVPKAYKDLFDALENNVPYAQYAEEAAAREGKV